MNRLPIEKRIQIVSLMVEGMSMRSISRVADVSINTVTKLLEDVGAACCAYQDQAMRNLQCTVRIQPPVERNAALSAARASSLGRLLISPLAGAGAAA